MKTAIAAATVACLFVLAPRLVMSDDSASSTWKCVSGGFERDIELFRKHDREGAVSVVSDSALACWVVYTRGGKTEVLWEARNDPNYCEPRVLALVEKLQTSGFRCLLSGETINSAGIDSTTAIKPHDAVTAMPEEKAAPARSRDVAALRRLLERHYDDSYLDAMVAAIPAGFSAHLGTDAVSAASGEVLHVGPPKHFVRTMSDGSYLLVNTLLLERGSTSSFVNLGFAVRDKRYRFLGYATVHSATEAKVQDADREKVALMVTTAAGQSCEASRRMQTIGWAADLRAPASGEAAEKQTTGEAHGSDCRD